MTESALMRRLQLEVTRLGARAMRNNVGLAYTKDGRPIRFGLAVGSSDLIGWRSLRITPAHVGQTIAQFLAVEVKTARGETTAAQKSFLDAVRQAGGIALVARSVDDLQEALGGSDS